MVAMVIDASGPGRSPGPFRFLRASVLGLWLWVLAAAQASSQEPGSIVGRVLDLTTGRPVPAAEVWVPMARRRVATNELGWFVVPSLPPGEYVVEAGRVGYSTEGRAVTVVGEAVSVELRLAPRPIELAGLDVVRFRSAAPVPPFEVGRIDLTREPAPSGKAIELLRRVLGAQVFRVSGEPGSAGSVRLRGPTSIAERREPLVVIDGAVTTLGALAGMPASDVAGIEVLKGAAAAAEYGSRGAAGVILVTTRRGADPKDR